MRLSFNKSKKLKKQRDFDQLFRDGNNLFKYPLKVKFISTEKEENKIAVVVPKSRIKLAVGRNKIKRRIRETYRLNQLTLNDSAHSWNICFIFVGKPNESYTRINESMQKLLKSIVEFPLKNTEDEKVL